MSVYLQDPDVTILQGDALELLRGLPDGSVHMACTSPPFYGLRDYGTGSWEGGDPDCDHIVFGGGPPESSSLDGAKQRGRSDVTRSPCGKCGAIRIDQQIGLEATPDEWCNRLVGVFRELRRVLRDDGSLWVEIGDSYAGSWGAQSRENGSGADSLSAGQIAAHPTGTRTGSIPPGASFKPKDLLGMPWLLAFALRADGWYLRSEIIWAKPNPMPESVTDRPTVSHSRVFLLTKRARYFWDAEAIRNPTGRNRRSVWSIPTQPYPEAHFATWPEKLVEPMILAGCPEGGVVLDPFAGSGTTGLVARRLGRRAVLLELNAEYCALAARRLAQQSLFAGQGETIAPPAAENAR